MRSAWSCESSRVLSETARPSGVGWRPAAADAVSDVELVELVRQGTVAAYAVLFERHRVVAGRCARRLCRCATSAEDVTSEAFARVLETLLAGGGPRSGFRPYLLVTVRNVAYTAARRDTRLELVADMTTIDQLSTGLVGDGADCAVVSGLDRAMAARALNQLPPAWQRVLQRTVVEGRSPAELTSELGLTSNGVSALAHRARRGLRTEFLQAHVDDTRVNPLCRSAAPQLSAWVRGQLLTRRHTRVDAHLAQCTPCRARLAELADVNALLPA